MKTLRHSLPLILLCATTLVCLPTLASAQTQIPQDSASHSESETLYRIAEFVEWPDSAPRPGATFNFCVLGKDPFGTSLDDAVLGHPIGERQTMIVRATRMGDLIACNVLFFGSSETARLPKILPKLHDKNILTVSESPDFAASGGIVELRRSEARISIVINVDAAHRAGLTFRAQLLSLAKVAHESELASRATDPGSRNF
ncbi:MAG TPA: YfiR family protein [Candidatus Acidoferrales bacterium]|nr:YfiR family protein [Candidatus Acidoferrales bacterium]